MSDLRETQDYLAEVIADRDRLRAALIEVRGIAASDGGRWDGRLAVRDTRENIVAHCDAALAGAGETKPDTQCGCMASCAVDMGATLGYGFQCRKHGRSLPASAPHRIPEANDRSWLCFHCDERFTDREEARQHFGEMRTGVALCQEPRDVQDALRRARDAENRWMDVAAKLGVERTENERLAHMLASWERQFGTTDPREAWNRLDSMEGRALAAEERLSAPPPPAPATEANDRADASAVVTVCQGCAERFVTNLPQSCPNCRAKIERLTRVLLNSEGLAAMRAALATPPPAAPAPAPEADIQKSSVRPRAGIDSPMHSLCYLHGCQKAAPPAAPDCQHCGGHPGGVDGKGTPCPACGSPGLHRSDCPVNNGPALPVGPCNCKPPPAPATEGKP